MRGCFENCSELQIALARSSRLGRLGHEVDYIVKFIEGVCGYCAASVEVDLTGSEKWDPGYPPRASDDA